MSSILSNIISNKISNSTKGCQMNISELLTNLKKLNIDLKYKDIYDLWGMDSASFSRKKKAGTEIKLKNIRQLENKYNIKLYQDKNIKQNINNDFINLPVYGDVYASMGHGVTIYNETQTGVYPISNQLAHDLGISKNKSQIIFARGDSMLPTIEGGDSLLVDMSKIEIYDGKIYCVRIDGQLYAKRLQKIPPSKIKVISDNKDKYDPFYIDFSQDFDFDFAVIGEIRWWGRIAK